MIFIIKTTIDSLPDVLDAKDIANVLGIGYVKSLRLIRYGGLNYIQVGRAYKVSKRNFLTWLNCDKPKVIELG